MPNMDELLKQISSELSKHESDPLCISGKDMDYAYEQTKLAPETSKPCNFELTGGKSTGYYSFVKGNRISQDAIRSNKQRTPSTSYTNQQAQNN